MSNNEPFIDILRHDTAHVLAMAVQELFPDAQVTIGPCLLYTSDAADDC